MNYIDPLIENWEQAYYGANYARLQQVKATYDPLGFFNIRFNEYVELVRKRLNLWVERRAERYHFKSVALSILYSLLMTAAFVTVVYCLRLGQQKLLTLIESGRKTRNIQVGGNCRRDSGTAAFKGVSVFLGLMVSLGSAGIVGQLLGGLIVVYSRAFQPGEYVKINDVEGVVSSIGILSIKIKTIRNEEVTIPNAILLGATSTHFTRLSKGSGVYHFTTVTIGYDTPWQQVHHLLLTAASRTADLRKEPAPMVRQTGLSDFYVEYRLIVFLDEPMEKVRIMSELHQHIQDAFAEAKVQIMSPHFEKQPDVDVLPKDWIAPAVEEKP